MNFIYVQSYSPCLYQEFIFLQKTHTSLGIILFSPVFLSLLPLCEFIERQTVPHSRKMEHCQASTTLCMYKIFVKMYRIGMLICILFLFQGSRDKLCYAHIYWSSHWCMNASLFVPLSSTAVPGIIFLFGILLEEKVVDWFEE